MGEASGASRVSLASARRGDDGEGDRDIIKSVPDHENESRTIKGKSLAGPTFGGSKCREGSKSQGCTPSMAAMTLPETLEEAAPGQNASPGHDVGPGGLIRPVPTLSIIIPVLNGAGDAGLVAETYGTAAGRAGDPWVLGCRCRW